MAGRQNWYSDHPAKCQCSTCNERRLGRASKQINRNKKAKWRASHEGPGLHPPGCNCPRCTSVRGLLEGIGDEPA